MRVTFEFYTPDGFLWEIIECYSQTDVALAVAQLDSAYDTLSLHIRLE